VKFEFKPEDFGRAGNPRGEIKELILTSTQAAELANTRLAEMLKDAPTVFGHIGTHASTWSSHPPGTFIQENNTHRAKLVMIEKIEGEE
jgi:hypothetical protein